MHESEFPPNKDEIWARLTSYDVDPLDFDSLTCDEAAQVISGIDSNGFNQADADDFEHISLLINRCIIAKTIPSIERDGKTYVKTLDVVKWAIARAETKEYELPSYVLNWFEKRKREHPETTEWKAMARELGESWMKEQRKEGKDPGIIDIAKFVEGELINRGITGTRGKFLDWETIRREALTGITGKSANGKGPKRRKQTGESPAIKTIPQ